MKKLITFVHKNGGNGGGNTEEVTTTSEAVTTTAATVAINEEGLNADYSLGVVVNVVSGEEVDSLAAENKCGKLKYLNCWLTFMTDFAIIKSADMLTQQNKIGGY